MALPSALKLFINPRRNLAFGNFEGTAQITNPTFTLGDTARIELYLVEDTNISSYPRQEIAWPGSPGIKVAIGPIDESPKAGTWEIVFGGDATSALAFNITATALSAAINALASITAAGGVTVSKIGDNYNIVFNQNGARALFTTDASSLIPLSTATASTLQEGDNTRPAISLIHLQRNVAGLATSFAATPASVLTIETLSAWNGQRVNYRASISPDPKGGSFSLSFDALTGSDVSTAALAVGAPALDIQNALSQGALLDKVSVTQVGAYAYDITATVQPDAAGLTANGSGIKSFSGYVGELTLNTAEAISLLDGAVLVSTTLEVEITSDSKTLTILQIACVLDNAVIDQGAVVPLVLDTYLTEVTADGRYARQSNNLNDLADLSVARANLDVYDTSAVDSLQALKADVAGATFGGDIIRDNGTGQTIIGPASVSFSQTGGGGSFINYGSVSLTFPDASVQSTAYTGSAAADFASITGQPNDNANLSQALSDKYDSTNPSNFITTANLSDGISVFVIGVPYELNPGDDTVSRLKLSQGTPQAVSTGDVWYDGQSLAYCDASSNARYLLESANPSISGALTFTGILTTLPPLNLGIERDAAPTYAINGSVWINNAAIPRLTYRSGGFNYNAALVNGTNNFSNYQSISTSSAAFPALRIEQKGTAPALVVEDSATPDANALVVDASGNVGIGLASAYTATQKLEVVGNIKADNNINGAGPAYRVNSVVAHTGGADTHDLLVSIGGSTYRIALRFVSTP